MTQTQILTKPVYDTILNLKIQAGKLRAELDKGKQKPSPAVLELLTSLDQSISGMADRVSNFETEHSNLLALTDVIKVVNSTLELDEVLRIVMDNIVRLTKSERGFLMLRDEGGEMTIRTGRNWEKASIDSNELTVSSTIVQRVIDSGEPIITTNAKEDQRFSGQASIVAFNLRSILCVPLKVKEDVIGVIYADNRVRTGLFSEPERDLLVTFGNQAAVAIENARLFTSLRQTLAEVTALKNLMDNVFASITSGVITMDVHNRITLSNRAAETILGSASQNLIGRDLEEVLAAISKDIEPRLDEVRKTDKPVMDIEISYRQAERGLVDWRMNVSPLKEDGKATKGIAIVLDDLTERKKLEAQRRLFGRMVSPAVIDQLDPDSLALGGRRVDITVLFADVRGFTTYSEKVSPEKLVAILNRYLAAMADAVLANEGTIDKFMGDAIMAWFNAPIEQKDHTLRAVKAALAMRDSVEELYKELPEEAHLAFGAGIHFGDAVLGLIGTEKRLEYTAIGDCVNTAKRIQENSAKNQILLTREAYNRVQKQVNVEPATSLVVKGKKEPLAVFELKGIKG
jgi:PAS domain S-box-containing protein